MLLSIKVTTETQRAESPLEPLWSVNEHLQPMQKKKSSFLAMERR